jgi:hypothetical protein
MALTKTPVTILASTQNSTYTSTKAAPGITGASIDVRNYFGGRLTWKITNGASAPGVAMWAVFQVSSDGANWVDYWTVAGDTNANSVISGSYPLDIPVMYVRVIAYGNTTNPVTLEAGLMAVTSLV